MANEIKFIFTGDTAAFDKAIDSVVKKTNKVKTATEKTTEAQKVQAKLQKLLNEEYSRAAKTTGGILKIQKDIKRTEQERVKLSKRLNDASISREKRLRTIVQLSKAEARLAGLTAAKRSAMTGAVTRGGSAALTRAGLGSAAAAGGLAAAAGGLAGLSATGVGALVAAVIVVVGGLIVAFKTLKAVVRETSAAMSKAMGLEKTAQMAGKTVEQVQAQQLAGLFGGSATGDVSLFKQLGLIVDREIIASLTRSGKTLMAFGIQVANVLIPIFEKLAKVTAGLVKIIGGSVVALKATFGPIFSYIASNPHSILSPFGMAMALGQADPSAGVKAFDDYVNKMADLTRLSFSEGLTAASGIARQTSTDSLARIGIFKGRADSELQTLKASLIVQRSIKSNTDGLITAIETA